MFVSGAYLEIEKFDGIEDEVGRIVSARADRGRDRAAGRFAGQIDFEIYVEMNRL
jgi:hypothetical protein